MAIDALVLGENTFPFHRFDAMAPLFETILKDAGTTVTTTTDRDALLDVEEYDVVVDYTTDSGFTDEQLDALFEFVEDGGGYAGVHCATDLTTTNGERRDEPHPRLRELLGAHFVTHPPRSQFEVNVVDSHHPITATVDDFDVWDEPYELVCDDDLRTLVRMDHPELGDMPVAWVKTYGDGHVYYCSLGHDRPAFHTEGVRELLRNGVRWAAAGETIV